MKVDDAMLHIKSLDNGASVKFSEWTGQWYVEASIEIGDGSVLTGGTEHRDTPDSAVLAYFTLLSSIDMSQTDRYLVSHYGRERREWRWNGAAFVEQTRVHA